MNKDQEGSPEVSDDQDDAIIGQAFRKSVWVLLALIAVGLCFWLVGRMPEDKGPEVVTEISVPSASMQAEVKVPGVGFTDVTESSGIDFKHVNGSFGEKWLPETMGSGVAVIDYDQDRAPDLFFVNACYWPEHLPDGATQPTHALYRNLGGGHFQDVTTQSGLDKTHYGMGVAVGDYDNDGWPDLFITGVGGNHLMHNTGEGYFEEVTREAGVGEGAQDWSTCAAFLDHDNDGDLDLFVGHYVQWSPSIDLEQGTTLTGLGRAYGQPMNFQGTYPALYENLGSGRFKDVSELAGLRIKNPATGVPVAKSLGVAPVDLDDDGFMDLII
ncbi:MAG: VCBS repeat-containing protein, partial [Verrucomicrobia bacterium]|nr:VCBS repeat-containing protein [Verrucomicrobiota bacterium]